MSIRLACLAVTIYVATIPTVAQAHAILVQSTPTLGGTINAGDATLTLRFNSRIDHDRSRLTLTRPDRSQTVLPVGGSDPPDILTAHATLPAGPYVLRWQVLAVDGHITRGDVPFTVVGAGGS